MKSIILFHILYLSMISLQAQNLYYYPLNSNFNEVSASANPLVAWPNASGQTGNFVSNGLPNTTCAATGVFDGYEYANNAGLRFDVPAGTISCEYSLLFTWRYDNPAGSQEWIRLLSFVYTDDAGLDLWTQFPSTNGTLYYWYLDPLISFPGFCFAQPTLAPLSPTDFFNETDYYRMAITRNCSNLLQVYANGNLIGTYNDVNQHYLPLAPSNQIVLFRDTADTSCYPTAFPDEASSGFIKDLVITDFEFTASALIADFDTFCPVLLAADFERFEAKATKLGNELAWRFPSVERVASFVVERSADAQDFQTIARISVLPQQSTTSFTDHHPAKNRSYYRLRAIYHNGGERLSEIRSVESQLELKLYPNPAQDQVNLNIPVNLVGQVLVIKNALGQTLWKQVLDAGTNTISIEAMPAGVLLFEVAGRSTQSVIKIK